MNPLPHRRTCAARKRLRTVLAMRRTIVAALTLCLPGCGSGSGRTATDAARDVSAAVDVAPTRVGLACASDGDCDALRCATRLQRMCQGPVRPHTVTIDFPGGYCNPTLDLARGDIPGGCPAGSTTYALLAGCDGIPFRFCGRRCAVDAECRVAEGYRCHLELNMCLPPSLLPEVSDAGVDAD